ncbi:MAG: YgiT-type zinc finger protein [Acidobacteriota bacterium]
MKRLRSDLCEFCEGEIEKRVVRTRFHYEKQTIYVDGVPVWMCPRCGEHYYDAAVYKRLEEIARNRRQIRRTVRFPLADYGKAIA